MRPTAASVALVVAALTSEGAIFGCRSKLEGRELIAAKADQTTRQLVAGLNAKSTGVLRSLIVVTSSAGALRPPTEAEVHGLVHPAAPFEQLGAGAPGIMNLRDGTGQKQAVRLVADGDAIKVLGVREPLAAVLGRAGQGPLDSRATEGLFVLTIMQPSAN